jgi:hypothetical protein
MRLADPPDRRLRALMLGRPAGLSLADTGAQPKGPRRAEIAFGAGRHIIFTGGQQVGNS